MKLHDLTVLEIQDMLLQLGIQKWQLPYFGLVPKDEWDRMTCVKELAKYLQDSADGLDQAIRVVKKPQFPS